ncbi:hypothetical protein E9O_09244 [Moraxella catarrhalis 12P80B1]|nr:hypothetical protein E9O_09244 [Moraxella catarrhalis 12P80B1]
MIQHDFIKQQKSLDLQGFYDDLWRLKILNDF